MLLTYRGAAKRVGRSVRTVKRWVRDGMPHTVDDVGRVVIDEQVLLAWYRQKLMNSPVSTRRNSGS